MAGQPETGYGPRTEQTRFDMGLEPLSVDDKNEILGENKAKIDPTLLASQLADIATMRRLIAENPSVPGDDKVLESEAMMLMNSRVNDSPISRKLEAYPDMLSEVADRMPEEIFSSVDDPILAGRAFREAPLEFVESLTPDELHELLKRVVAPQFYVDELAKSDTAKPADYDLAS